MSSAVDSERCKLDVLSNTITENVKGDSQTLQLSDDFPKDTYAFKLVPSDGGDANYSVRFEFEGNGEAPATTESSSTKIETTTESSSTKETSTSSEEKTTVTKTSSKEMTTPEPTPSSTSKEGESPPCHDRKMKQANSLQNHPPPAAPAVARRPPAPLTLPPASARPVSLSSPPSPPSLVTSCKGRECEILIGSLGSASLRTCPSCDSLQLVGQWLA